MLACVDTYHTASESVTGVVLFREWSTGIAAAEHVHHFPIRPEPYSPGAFYLRELPCTLSSINLHASKLKVVVIDGYVWLSPTGEKGLGAHLHESLGDNISIIGVAKNWFAGSNGIEVYRGGSRRPLYVTSAGIANDEAARLISSMHGQHRIPTLIKRADYISRFGLMGSTARSRGTKD